MQSNNGKIFLDTVKWGFALWLFGYVLGIVFFAFVPKEQIGYFVMPLGMAFTLWVLWKKIQREELMCYFGLGIILTLMAVILDYLFNVKLFHLADYYKADVYLYYVLTLLLPIVFGWYRFKIRKV